MPETYETCSYSVPPSVRFKALSEKYGDTAYNRPPAPFDWRDLPEDYRIENGISYLEGYLPVNGTLCELDAEEMYMLDPFELYLKFTILPEIKKHTVTVVLREQETEITGSTEIIFP